MARTPTLTVTEAAAQAGVSPQRIRQLLAAGTLRGKKADGPVAYWLVDVRSLAKWSEGRA